MLVLFILIVLFDFALLVYLLCYTSVVSYLC